MHKHSVTPPGRQRGVATLLIVLMLGLAVSVTVMATVYSVRSAQSQQLTSHTATTAQAAAWRGVEALRQYLLQVDKATWPTWVGKIDRPVTGMDALGVSAATVTDIEAQSSDTYRVQARVTGKAGVGNAQTTATVEVVYVVAPDADVPGAPGVCHSLPTAPMVFNGDLNYSGGKLDVDDGTAQSWDYKNIVVAGKLTVGGGSTARISGCVKGDVDISGGGITDNGHLYSEGAITIGGLKFPDSTALWGKSVTFNGGSGGPPNQVWAGAYQVGVYSGGAAIGSAEVGGTLLPATVSNSSQLPWTKGDVLPVNTGSVVVTLADKSQYLLDMSKLTIDASTGIVSGARAAATQLSGGAANLPDVLVFKATGIAGGDITMAAGASLGISGTVWGHDVTLKQTSVQTFTTLWANGTLKIGTGMVTSLVGGGDLQATSGACRTSDNGCDNFPTVAAGTLAGIVRDRSGLPIPNGPTPLPNVKQQQVSTSPGLPGLPWCDARVNAIDTDSFKTAANYVYESVGGKAQLTIQHVSRADGTSIDGIYPLGSLTASQKATLESLMLCNNTNDKGCLKLRQDDGSWLLGGVGKFPPGVVWFDAALKVSGTTVDLLNTLVNKGGDIMLDSSGHGGLIAPNRTDVAKVCGADFYPTNLCASRTAFATWEDADGNTHVGLPIANTAVITEGGLSAQGWTLTGNVVLGGQMNTSGALVNVQGSLTVGSNQTSSTTISAGGIHVETPKGGDQNQLPVCSAGGNAVHRDASATVQWSRYL